MDDNKMLTLASNERIPLTGTMRLLLEINHMNHCSPATVSRGGVVFMNAEDVGWRPPVESWMNSLEVTEYKPLLTALFDRYADASMDHCRKCVFLCSWGVPRCTGFEHQQARDQTIPVAPAWHPRHDNQ